MSAETLRYATLSLSGATRNPLFERSSAVSIESIRYLGPIEDEQYVGLYDLSGDLDVARELLATSDRVLRYDVAGTDDRGIVYAHFQSVGPIKDLLRILYRDDIVLDWPIEHHRTRNRHEARFTVIGTQTGIQRAVDDIPDTVGLSVEQTGQFTLRNEARPLLTDMQDTLLELAIEEGYYEVPRETTQHALADHLGVTPGTVGDRLQRIERRVMTAYTSNSH